MFYRSLRFEFCCLSFIRVWLCQRISSCLPGKHFGPIDMYKFRLETVKLVSAWSYAECEQLCIGWENLHKTQIERGVPVDTDGFFSVICVCSYCNEYNVLNYCVMTLNRPSSDRLHNFISAVMVSLTYPLHLIPNKSIKPNWANESALDSLLLICFGSCTNQIESNEHLLDEMESPFLVIYFQLVQNQKQKQKNIYHSYRLCAVQCV